MLAAHPCQAVCDWARTGRVAGGRRLFRCAGCGSEWTAAELWTPAQADGTVPPAVAAERDGTVPPAVAAERDGTVPPAVAAERDGTVPPAVAAERDGTVPPAVAAERDLTTDRGGDAAGSSDRSRTSGS